MAFTSLQPQLSHSQIISNVSDLPASRKTAGLPSHNSKIFMLSAPVHFLNVFNDSWLEFVARDDKRHLKYAFRVRDTSPEIAEDIFRNRGIRWSIMNELANWFPAASSSIEPMHCIFLTMVKHVNRTIIYNNGLLNSASGVEKMEAFFSKTIWPVSVGRLPPSLSHGAGSVKADQWRNQISVLFLALFVSWQVDGEIPDIKASPSMDRSLRRHYDAIINFTAAPQLYAMGPLYAWWTYAYERNNGLLGRFNHNDHSGGQLKGTMMRR
ncbi:hypothetical protein C8J57DRAFT_1439267 [Mycena rebaudengoi]|nr:hypothetical protein C8J57DRAFT_1439267 [Mycena rebaudengoi]